MATFLEQLAEALIAEHGASLRDTAVVLPSQRAGLYLRKALARAAGSALWSPEIFTLASFMERVSGLRTLPMDELLFEAFEGYRSIAGDDARSFDDFLQWVPITLSDISEADAHVVPLAGFYRDLRSWEELDWSFNTTPLSDGQQRMVRYWAMVGKLHAALNARLLAKGTGTTGLVERTAAERIATVELPWKHAWFAGLNAFNAAQWRTIDHLHSTGIAHFAWDADQYYLNDQQQEAGQQLREAIAHFGKGAIAPSAALHAEHLHLRVTRAPNTVAQAWSAADRLRELSDDERSNTAIILADETLLPALLEALSGDHGDINITMGLTLASMPAGSLLSGFRTLVAGAQESNGYFHADVERLLLHPFLRHGADASIIDAAIALIADAGHVRLSPGMIQNALGSLPRTIQDAVVHVFPQMDETTDMGTRTIALIAWAQANMRGDAFATEQLYQASIALRKAHVLMERYGHPTDPSTYATITGRLLRSARVGLFGEPLSGLQVMGALEARALDFQRVIVLGAQEGKLPANSSDRSYIPFELRRGYKLPLRETTDAVQAYNFLRIVQRAADVELIHADEDGASGPSRYIAQLRHELFHDSDRMSAADARIPVPIRTTRGISVPNDATTQTALRDLLKKGLTPTKLGTWLRCPLDFWFRHVLRLHEPETPEVRIGANVLGEALHTTVESIYKPWLGRPLSAEDLREAMKTVGDRLHENLVVLRPVQELQQGQPLLQLGMATHAAEKFLLNEARLVESGARIATLALEEELQAPVESAISTIGSQVVIKGRLDRVDDRDGVIHILDLKTGRVDARSIMIPELKLDALVGDKRYAAQLLIYAWLYLTVHADVSAVKAGLLPLQRASEAEGVYLRVANDPLITRSHLPAIEAMITEVIGIMLDPSQPFSHDERSEYCVFCAK